MKAALRVSGSRCGAGTPCWQRPADARSWAQSSLGTQCAPNRTGAGREPVARRCCGPATWAPGKDPAGGMAGTPLAGAARAPADPHLCVCARWGQMAVSRAGARMGSEGAQDRTEGSLQTLNRVCRVRGSPRRSASSPFVAKSRLALSLDLACCRGSCSGTHAEPCSRPPSVSVGAAPPCDGTAGCHRAVSGLASRTRVTWVKPSLLLLTKKAGEQRRRPCKLETGNAGSLPTQSVTAVHISK